MDLFIEHKCTKRLRIHCDCVRVFCTQFLCRQCSDCHGYMHAILFPFAFQFNINTILYHSIHTSLTFISASFINMWVFMYLSMSYSLLTPSDIATSLNNQRPI